MQPPSALGVPLDECHRGLRKIWVRLGTGREFRGGCAPLCPTGIAPNITRGPQDSTVIDGMAVILNCETSGAPRPAITWQKGKGLATSLSSEPCPGLAAALTGSAVSPGERVLASGSVQLPRFTLLESGSLLVSPAHLPDAGTYTCLATNSRGVDEASADLVVWGKGLTVGPQPEGGSLPGSGQHPGRCGMELSGGGCCVLGVQTGAVPAGATPTVPVVRCVPLQQGHGSRTRHRTRASSRAPRLS